MFKSKERKQLEGKVDSLLRLSDSGSGFGAGDQELQILVAGAQLAHEKLKEMRVSRLEYTNFFWYSLIF